MKMTQIVLLIAAGGTAQAGPAVLEVADDYMTSGFFQSNYIRGDENPSNRAVNRATSETIFGVTGESTYFGFDFDPASFSGPVAQAVFQVEVVANGFFGDPSATNPAEISLHSLTADPLAAIDDNVQSSFIDFRDAQLTNASVVSTTSVDGLGVFEWDVTALVNEWIANGDTNLAYTFGMSAVLDADPGTAIGFVNSSSSALTDELTGRIVFIPAPGTLALSMIAMPVVARRRRA